MTTTGWPWRAEASCLACEQTFACNALNTCLDNPTDAARLDSVTRAVEFMHARIGEPQRLSDIAQAALLSPFHFHRIFRHVTSTTPARFLTALRMAEARHLLANSTLSVTDVCLSVGYSSLGTFISQFTKLAGLPPRRFRAALSSFGDVRLCELADTGSERHTAPGPLGAVTGGPAGGGCALLALYASTAPDEAPVTYGVMETNRLTHTSPLADGAYQAVALGFDRETTLVDVLGSSRRGSDFVGAADSPIVVDGGRSRSSFHVALRRPRTIDPPLQLTSALLSLGRHRRPQFAGTAP